MYVRMYSKRAANLNKFKIHVICRSLKVLLYDPHDQAKACIYRVGCIQILLRLDVRIVCAAGIWCDLQIR
jgi:hypothetical protein